MPHKMLFVTRRILPLFFCAIIGAPMAHAKEAGGDKDAPAAVKMDDPVVLSLGARLRCPVCQGMPIGESPAPMAQDMMREVRRMRLDEGQSEDAIAKHFTDRYGTWVLLDPPKSGFGLLVWLLPPAALVIGLGAALGALAHKRAQAGATGAVGADTPPKAADADLLEQVRRQVRS